ncbi:MAG: 30S ribosomal protein S1 [Armatimonadota bacterium]
MSAWDFEDRRDAREPLDSEEKSAAAEPVQAGRREHAEPEEPVTMADVDLRDAGPASLKPGDIVRGVVVEVNEDGVLVDVGGKAEGIVPMYEFLDRSEMPERDGEIEVAVVKLQDDEGMTILSKKRADYERVWNRVMSALETGEVLDAMVTDRVKGGLRVDLGVAGFVPASHVATRDVRNLDRFVGRSLRLKVLEADRERKKVVLSHRLVVEEERAQRRRETMAQLHEGLVCEGKVRNITDYGAFIDLGGVDGLLHISEMSWGRVEHPSDVCSVGDTVRVVVLEIDRERERISLGRRQILPDPWKEVGKRLRPGSIVTGRVNRIVRTGAFVELPEFEVEGFLPVGELSDRRIENPAEVIAEGQELQLQVLKLRPQARRITLSLVAALEEKERQEYQQYMADQEAPRTTLGDQFADVLGAVAAELDESEAGAGAEAGAEEAAAEEGEQSSAEKGAGARGEAIGAEDAAPTAEDEQ